MLFYFAKKNMYYSNINYNLFVFQAQRNFVDISNTYVNKISVMYYYGI